jgi:hypothetical protein
VHDAIALELAEVLADRHALGRLERQTVLPQRLPRLLDRHPARLVDVLLTRRECLSVAMPAQEVTWCCIRSYVSASRVS